MKKSSTVWIVVLIVVIVLVVIGVIVSMNSGSTSYAPAATNTSSSYVQNGQAGQTATGQYADSQQPMQATLTSTSTGVVVLDSATSPKLGTYLIASNGMTVYQYNMDTSGVSNCYGACASSWPPYIASSTPPFVTGAGVGGAVSTTKRTDGTLQFTFNGLPLYFWQGDSNPGDATGQKVQGFTVVVL